MGNRFREKVTEEGLTGEEQAVETQDVAAESKETVEQEEAAEGKGGVAKGVARVLGGNILADKLVLKQVWLLLLCLLFLLLIVANRYKVEQLSREKIATTERINDLREQRIQMQKRYQKSVMISQIADDLKERGVGITSGPPYEIEN